MLSSKTIWIINQYASTPDTGIGGRHYHLARELAKQGHKVYLIAASYSHILHKPIKLNQPYKSYEIEGFNLVYVKMPSYVNAHSLSRILNWVRFAFKIRRLVNYIKDAPDVILYSSPSLIGYLGSKHIKNVYPYAQLIFEVRDIWPLTLIELGGYSPNNLFIRFLQWIEDKAYQDADRVISNLKNAVIHMESRGMNKAKFLWIPNGFSNEEIKNKQKLSEDIVKNLPEGKFIVGYTGTIGVANALEYLIGAALLLQKNPEIVFVIVGSGKEKSKLVDLISKHKLNNIYFLESIPKVQIPSMLSKFDVCYIGWNNNPLYQFGIAANKISEYFMAAKPILHSYSGKLDPVEEAKAGITVSAGDSHAIANAIRKLYSLTDAQRRVLGENGRNYALEHYEYGLLAKKLIDAIVM